MVDGIIGIKNLPFVDVIQNNTKSGFCFWSVEKEKDYQNDFAIGRYYAQEALRYMLQTNSPHFLTWIIFDMIRQGNCSGTEAGFTNEVSRYAMQLEPLPILL